VDRGCDILKLVEVEEKKEREYDYREKLPNSSTRGHESSNRVLEWTPSVGLRISD